VFFLIESEIFFKTTSRLAFINICNFFYHVRNCRYYKYQSNTNQIQWSNRLT